MDQIRAARTYTTGLLETIEPRDWFRQPAEGVTHVAWQVGHLAFAQYKLALERIRGARPDDDRLISADFLAKFARGTVPDPDPARYPAPAEIRAVFDGVYKQALDELKDLPDPELDQSPAGPALPLPHQGGRAALVQPARDAPCRADRPVAAVAGISPFR